MLLPGWRRGRDDIGEGAGFAQRLDEAIEMGDLAAGFLGRLSDDAALGECRQEACLGLGDGSERDIVADPQETKDLAAQKPDVVEALRRQLDGWWKPGA